MNVNFQNSVADRRMKFSSTLEVKAAKENDNFNAFSIYIPKSFAEANLVDFDASVVTKDDPAVITCTVDNYLEEMQGDILDQWRPIFRDDTNSDVVLYLIVFYDTDSDPTSWVIGTKSISFAPLTTAFKKLYTISYMKFLFDPDYTGENVTIPGSAASALLTFTNGGIAAKTLSAGEYTFNDGTKTWRFTLATAQTVAAGGTLASVQAVATTRGPSTLAQGGTIPSNAISPTVDADFTIAATTLTPGVADASKSSMYFDLALAFSYLVMSNIKLSCTINLVRLDITKYGAVDGNKCWIGSADAGAEKTAMKSLSTGDRAKYFWGALVLMDAKNVGVYADCVNEVRYLPAISFAVWFASKNATGLYIGNKMHLVAIDGQNCFGLPSALDASYNDNDGTRFDIFDEKNVGYLSSVSARSNSASSISVCRGVTGFPLNALMIAKYADFQNANDAAEFVTASGTLTDPNLTDADAYKKIQNVTLGNIGLFTKTRRISSVVSKFPSFNQAKVGRTALKAATAWAATYIDDLDSVDISGGVTAE